MDRSRRRESPTTPDGATPGPPRPPIDGLSNAAATGPCGVRDGDGQVGSRQALPVDGEPSEPGFLPASSLQPPLFPLAPRPPTSAVLRTLGEDLAGDSIALGELSTRLGERAFGMVILLPALVNLIPNLPGLTTMFGLLMLFPAVQMALGRRELWLPRAVARRQIGVARLRRLIELSLPIVRRVERYLRPRWSHLTYPPWESLVGIALSVLCLLVAIPIPLTNFVPGLAVLLVALGLVERDGLMILAGIALGSAVLIAGIGLALWFLR
jgi:hypothetical protein